MAILVIIGAQTGVGQNQSGNNLNEFMINYYLENPYSVAGDTNRRSGFAKDFDRTFAIWGPRLYPHGNYQIARVAISAHNLTFFNQNQSNQQYSNVIWEPLGPVGQTLPSTYPGPWADGIGQVHRITFDPQYNITNQTIYAASFYGGLWKTINDGNFWEVLNTDLQLPNVSVSDVAVDFNNSNNLFISTGMGDGGIDFISNPTI